MRRRLLHTVLTAAGSFFLVGLYPMARLWPAGFGWYPPHPAFERMMTALYATLGVFLLLATRAPERYRPIIDFTIVSSLAHGGVMAYDAWRQPENRLHLATDITGLWALAALLLVLRPAVRLPIAEHGVEGDESRREGQTPVSPMGQAGPEPVAVEHPRQRPTPPSGPPS